MDINNICIYYGYKKRIKICMEMIHTNLRILNTDWVASQERMKTRKDLAMLLLKLDLK